jgi:hypothetical protein
MQQQQQQQQQQQAAATTATTATATAATATAATAGVSVKRNRTAKALVGATGPTGRGTSSRRRESQGPDQTSFQVVEALSSSGCRTATVTTQRLRIDPAGCAQKRSKCAQNRTKTADFSHSLSAYSRTSRRFLY